MPLHVQKQNKIKTDLEKTTKRHQANNNQSQTTYIHTHHAHVLILNFLHMHLISNLDFAVHYVHEPIYSLYFFQTFVVWCAACFWVRVNTYFLSLSLFLLYVCKRCIIIIRSTNLLGSVKFLISFWLLLVRKRFFL